MGSAGSKSPKNEVFRVLAKILSTQICFLLHHVSVNGLFTFYKNNMFRKSLVLELWSKNLKTNQKARFFKLEFLKNKLRYKVEFLDVTRGP